MREPGSASGQRFQPAELAPLLQPLLEKLFGVRAGRMGREGGWRRWRWGQQFRLGGKIALFLLSWLGACFLQKARRALLRGPPSPPFLQAFKFPESGENEYLMQAVMRVIAFVGEPSSCGVRCSVQQRCCASQAAGQHVPRAVTSQDSAHSLVCTVSHQACPIGPLPVPARQANCAGGARVPAAAVCAAAGGVPEPAAARVQPLPVRVGGSPRAVSFTVSRCKVNASAMPSAMPLLFAAGFPPRIAPGSFGPPQHPCCAALPAAPAGTAAK